MGFLQSIYVRLCSMPDWVYAFSVTFSACLLIWPLKKSAKSVLLFCAGAASFCLLFTVLGGVLSWLIGLLLPMKFYGFNLATDCTLTVCYVACMFVPGRPNRKSRVLMLGTLYVSSLILQQAVGAVSVLVEFGCGVTGVALEWVRNGVNLLLIDVAGFLLYFELGRFDYIPVPLLVVMGSMAVILFTMRQVNSTVLIFSALDITGHVYLLTLYILALFIVLLIYYMMYSVCRDRNMTIEREKQRAYLKATETMVKIADSGLRGLREVRHDIRNQIASMAFLFRKKDYRALEKFFYSYSSDVEERLEYIDCGNPEVSAVLNLESSKAKAAGIRFEYSVAVPQALPFLPSELCSVLTNCIDNAVEACAREKPEKAYVRTEISLRGEYLHVYVENPTLQKRPRAETSKADKQEHGYGKGIVKKIVEKYNGAYHENVAEGLYKVSVFLDTGRDFPSPRRENESEN